MLSESTTGVEAGEWFDRLPTDADRRTVTGIVAMAYQFEWSNYRDQYGCRYSTAAGYLGVYAIGSRSLAQEVPSSDIDLLVAHNLSFDQGGGIRSIDYMREVDFDMLPEDGVWTDEEKADSGYEAAYRLENNFGRGSLNSDPVSNTLSYGIAEAGTNYRLPHSFDGELPDNYMVGGRDHKAFARYKAGDDMTAFDMVYYKGWHTVDKTTDEEDEQNQEVEVLEADSRSKRQRSVCGPKCQEAGFAEGANQRSFETIIDTDTNENELPRIPLYTFGDNQKVIYIPQIEDLIIAEQRKADAERGWRFKYSWRVDHPSGT